MRLRVSLHCAVALMMISAGQASAQDSQPAAQPSGLTTLELRVQVGSDSTWRLARFTRVGGCRAFVFEADLAPEMGFEAHGFGNAARAQTRERKPDATWTDVPADSIVAWRGCAPAAAPPE